MHAIDQESWGDTCLYFRPDQAGTGGVLALRETCWEPTAAVYFYEQQPDRYHLCLFTINPKPSRRPQARLPKLTTPSLLF